MLSDFDSFLNVSNVCIYNKMFDFLQKLSHQHPPSKKQEPNQIEEQEQFYHNEQSAKQLNKKTVVTQKNKPKILSVSAQLQKGVSAQLDRDTMKILEALQVQSEALFSDLVLDMVTEAKGEVERRVYLREMSHNNQEYLQQILIQSSSSSPYVRNGISEIVDNVASSIFNDILFTDRYQITKKARISKDEIALLEKSMGQIKSNDGNIREKVGELMLQLQNQSEKINEKSEEIINKKSFSANHPKTKEVQAFLKAIQIERQQQRQKYERNLQREKQRRKQREIYLESQREKAQSERHQRLVQIHQVKRKAKQQEFYNSQRKNQQFKEWMKAYKNKKPLFREKQEIIQNLAKQEHQEMQNKLMRRKQIYAPLDTEELQDHEQRYLDYKKDNEIRKYAQRRMLRQEERKRQQDLDKLHKGQFRYQILKQMIEKKEERDPKQDIIEKKVRQIAYSQNVRDYYKPKIDPVKRMEIESSLRPNRRKKNRVRVSYSSIGEENSYAFTSNYDDNEIEKDPKVEGEKHRRYFKQYIREKIEKGEVKRQDRIRSVTIQPQPNYLLEVRKSRETGIKSGESIDYEIASIKQKQDISSLISLVEQCDTKSKRMEQKFRLAPHKAEEEAALEDNYLFAIKAKMELLKNYD